MQEQICLQMYLLTAEAPFHNPVQAILNGLSPYSSLQQLNLLN